ncbi:MAG: GspE/PulE family protein [Candidatus Berkelbacteria bacterium]|nr:GspE/PulE family protein [Candidatus Berkelbacteria bacterium]
MQIDDAKLAEILTKLGYVKPEDLKKAQEEAKKKEASIVDYLLAEHILTKDLMGQAIAEYFGVKYADLSSRETSHEEERKIPEELAEKYRISVFLETDKHVIIATDDPTKKEIITALEPVYQGKQIEIAFAFPEDMELGIIQSKKPLETRFSKIIASQVRVAPEMVKEIIEDALANRASDVHIEPQEKEVVVRFRIDGVLHEVGTIPKVTYENILNRIKVQAHLRVDEHFSAQDGSMRYHREDGSIDLRVSIVPTIEGENIVMRLLAVYVPNLTLGDLGISPNDQELVMRAARQPFGMILAVGPTGSGKTTTLYALLKTFNNTEVNLTTIEDPVEYKMAKANQIQVNPQTNLTFAKGLRSIVRQDPDIILVGEIRDNETAEIAVNAALTGHLLFSTFHANDAATGIPRLLDMAIEPFLLSSTLHLIIAQRLVRKICEKCRVSGEVSITDIEKILPSARTYFPEEKITLYKGKGCKACGNKGFEGRTAIFEFIATSPQMQELILKNPSSQEVWELAKSQGSRALFEDGIDKVKKGETSLEELLRVASPPDGLKVKK